MINAVAIVCGYLLGSIPSAYLAARIKKGIDIRNVGSRTVGALNVYYEVGLAAGILVLLIDIGKGIAAVLLARWLGVDLIFQLLAGLAAVLGHIFPVFLKFHGGRGGATTIGVLLILLPKAIPFWLGTCVIVLLITRNLTFCYSMGFICFPVVAGLIYGDVSLVAFSLGLPLFLGIRYIPRLSEMRSKTGGSWWKVISRGSVKERL
jgi:glycerol-3-phosphate acyltransferase PlsY